MFFFLKKTEQITRFDGHVGRLEAVAVHFTQGCARGGAPHMRTAWIALAMIVVCGAWADSNPPTPAPTEARHEPQHQTENEGAKAKELSQPANQQSPVVFTASPSIYVEAPNQEPHDDKNSSAERWSIVIAAALLVVAFFQLLTYRRQAKIMEDQTQILGKQNDMTVSLERPYVYGGISKPGLKIVPSKTRFASELERGPLEVCIYNFGKTPAILTRIQIDRSLMPRGDSPPVIDSTTIGGRELPVGTVTANGDPYVEATDMRLEYFNEEIDIVENRLALWVVGFARFVDVFGVHHITGFAATFDLISGRFVRYGSEKYNYTRVEDPSKIPPKSG
jgi:hypothetical protein